MQIDPVTGIQRLDVVLSAATAPANFGNGLAAKPPVYEIRQAVRLGVSALSFFQSALSHSTASEVSFARKYERLVRSSKR